LNIRADSFPSPYSPPQTNCFALLLPWIQFWHLFWQFNIKLNSNFLALSLDNRWHNIAPQDLSYISHVFNRAGVSAKIFEMKLWRYKTETLNKKSKRDFNVSSYSIYTAATREMNKGRSKISSAQKTRKLTPSSLSVCIMFALHQPPLRADVIYNFRNLEIAMPFSFQRYSIRKTCVNSMVRRCFLRLGKNFTPYRSMLLRYVESKNIGKKYFKDRIFTIGVDLGIKKKNGGLLSTVVGGI